MSTNRSYTCPRCVPDGHPLGEISTRAGARPPKQPPTCLSCGQRAAWCDDLETQEVLPLEGA